MSGETFTTLRLQALRVCVKTGRRFAGHAAGATKWYGQSSYNHWVGGYHYAENDETRVNTMSWAFALIALIWGTPIVLATVALIAYLLSTTCRSSLTKIMFGQAPAGRSAAVPEDSKLPS